ncbi:MAG: amino acid adenylation domain-containing protein [Candidatus Aminicenantes bacterium]|jgi:amino acid adenylation domain-containing protein
MMVRKNIPREIEIAAAQNVKERDYWMSKFSDGVVKSSFPYDHQPTTHREREIETFNFKWDGQLFSQLMGLSKGKDHTLHIILAAGLAALLHRYTGSDDITIGTSIYRQAVEGEFINTLLPLRNRLNPETTFRELLIRMKHTVLEAAAHQAYPVELLGERLNLPVSNHRFPFFDIALLLENIQDKKYLQHIAPDMVFRFLRNPGNIKASVQYNPACYQSSTAANIAAHFTHLLDEGVSNPGLRISDLEILGKEEKRKLLLDFNDTDAGYPGDKTLQRLFAEQVERTPDQAALIGQNPRQEGTRGLAPLFDQVSICYRELNKKSDQFACVLIAKGVQADAIVGIMTERSVEMIIGILAVLKAGGAYLPIDPDYPQDRINYMLKDSNANVLLSTPDLTTAIEPAFSTLTSTCQVNPANLAYVIYTSGTTGKARGVLIRHRNVVRLMKNDKFLFDFRNDDVWSMFHSFCFDFSVWEMYGALLYGGRLVIIPKMTARDMGKFLQVLKEKQVTILNQIPTVFYNLIDEELKCVDRRLNLRWVIFGGEALKPGKLSKWKEKYPRTQLINMYGITETTVHVTFKAIQARDMKLNISNIGKPIPTLTVYVLDKNSALLPPGVPGELCVGGEGVGRGYLNQPGLTAVKFVPNPYKPDDILYKSGDLARFLENGEMEYLGRWDHQVKIRGFRIELGEIESQLLRHRAVKDAVVLAREHSQGDKYLCAYIVSADPGGKKIDSNGFAAYLSGTLPDYMIPTYFVPMKKLPLTPNGKIDRQALPQPGVNTGDNFTAPRDWPERKLAELFSRLLGIQKEKIGINTHFFKAGGHSLKAAQLTTIVHQAFNVNLSIVDIFKAPYLRELAETIKKSGQVAYTAVEPTEKKEYYPLSPIQKRLFIISQMEDIGTAYNLTEIFIAAGPLDGQRLEQASRLLIRRHDSLRTSFVMVNDELVQRVHEENDKCQITNYKQIPDFKSQITTIIKNFIRPFDLAAAPLLRMGLVETDDKKYLFLVDIHHIVSDGTSQGILFRDLFALYEGRELPKLPIQYKDFSLWQTSAKGKSEIARQEQYWLRKFEKKLPNGDIFTDFPRPSLQSFKGEQLSFTLQKELVENINRLTIETGTTLYMVLLAVYSILLTKYTGQEDIIVGTPVAGREHGDLENLIGIFINALPMRNYPKRELTFVEFLDNVKENTLNAFENQAYPFDYLLEKLNIEVDLSRNPVFDVELVLLNMEPQELAAGELRFIPYDYEVKVTQVDMALYGIESGKEIRFNLFYAAALFKRSTMERFIDYFKEVLRAVLGDRNIKLKDIHISSALAGTESEAYRHLENNLEF